MTMNLEKFCIHDRVVYSTNNSSSAFNSCVPLSTPVSGIISKDVKCRGFPLQNYESDRSTTERTISTLKSTCLS